MACLAPRIPKSENVQRQRQSAGDQRWCKKQQRAKDDERWIQTSYRERSHTQKPAAESAEPTTLVTLNRAS